MWVVGSGPPSEEDIRGCGASQRSSHEARAPCSPQTPDSNSAGAIRCMSQEARGLCSSPVPSWGAQGAGEWPWPGSKNVRSPAVENSLPPSLPNTSPPGQPHGAILLEKPVLARHPPPTPGPSWRGRGSPSTHGLPQGLRSGLQLGSQSLFLFVQKNPSPRESSQRHCAGKIRPQGLEG